MKKHLNWFWRSGDGNAAPVASSLSLTYDGSLYHSLSFTYSDSDGDLQAEPLPIASGVSFESTRIYQGQVLNASYNYIQINGATEGATTFSWIRSDNTSGLNATEVGTSSTYTLVAGDVGKFIRLAVTPKTSSGLTGTTVYSNYSSAIEVFDPFTDITHWNVALDPATASVDLASNIWTNQGLGSDAVQTVTSLPEWDATEGKVRFVRANSDGFRVATGVTFANPVTVWIKFKTPASYTGTQGVIALGNTLRTWYSSTGALTIFGVSSGVTLTTSTVYVLKVKMNGTGSTYSLNGGADTAISLSNNAGTVTVRLGCWYDETNYFNGWMEEVFVSETGTTDDEDALIKTYFGL